jgi:hypothetical protein
MLRSKLIFVTALGFAAPAWAEPVPIVSTYQGETFEYVGTLGKDGAVRLAGKFLNSGNPFTFTVKPSGRVHGFVGETPVDFKVQRKKHEAIAKSLKAAEPQVAGTTAALSAGTN